jgi:hypothetical protein
MLKHSHQLFNQLFIMLQQNKRQLLVVKQLNNQLKVKFMLFKLLLLQLMFIMLLLSEQPSRVQLPIEDISI